jgi:hypothetical protein
VSATFKFTPANKKVVEDMFSKALFACQEQIITDCNYYARKNTGVMIATSRTRGVAPVMNEDTSHVDGLALYVVWDTPYAKKVYYTGTPLTDKNPNASLLWAEKAAKQWRGDWAKILTKGMAEAK